MSHIPPDPTPFRIIGGLLLWGAALWTGAILETLGDGKYKRLNKLGCWLNNACFILMTIAVACGGIYMLFFAR